MGRLYCRGRDRCKMTWRAQLDGDKKDMGLRPGMVLNKYWISIEEISANRKKTCNINWRSRLGDRASITDNDDTIATLTSLTKASLINQHVGTNGNLYFDQVSAEYRCLPYKLCNKMELWQTTLYYWHPNKIQTTISAHMQIFKTKRWLIDV